MSEFLRERSEVYDFAAKALERAKRERARADFAEAVLRLLAERAETLSQERPEVLVLRKNEARLLRETVEALGEPEE